MNKYIFFNNDFVAEDHAKLHVSDLAVQRGYGVFDYFRVIDNRPLFLREHLQRFFHSASHMHLVIPYTEDELTTVINQLLQKNNIAQSGVRMTLTGGYATDGYTIGKPNLIITQAPLQLPDSLAFEKGLMLITHEHQRQMPNVKTIDYLMAIWLQPKIRESGAVDVLYCSNGAVTECPRANFFIVTKQDEILTPAEGVLKGITRMQLLKQKEFNVKEQPVLLDDVKKAKEAFISSTTKGVLPVVQIDGLAIGNGVPGKLTKALHKALLGIHLQERVHTR